MTRQRATVSEKKQRRAYVLRMIGEGWGITCTELRRMGIDTTTVEMVIFRISDGLGFGLAAGPETLALR